MKLISLKINWFKNLDFWENPIDFTKSEWISIFVWNNWSWKSNVLEAISAIFYFLYNIKNTPDFKFHIVYYINWDNIDILYKWHYKWAYSYMFKSNWIEIQKEDLYKYLPSQIIALYSWEETRLYEYYYKKGFQDYISSIISNSKTLEYPKMNFLDKDFWNIAILTLFISVFNFDESDNLYKWLEKILWKWISLKKIYFDINEENLEKFKQNKVTNFVNILKGINNISIEKLIELNNDTWILWSREDFLKNLHIACNQKDLKNSLIFSIDIELNNWVNTNLLSEWQKKQILIYFVTNFLADKDSIILLDEPDSYIHVWNKQRLKEFFDDFLSITKEGEFIMTTHSPTLMNKFDKNHLFYLENGKLFDKNQAEILKEISWDTMSYTEQQIILNTSKDIIIVEWKTDEIYIKTALEKLKEDNPKYKDLDFEFLLMWWSDYEILKRFSEQFPAKQWQKIMAFFDRDDSGLKCIKNALWEESLQKDTFTWKKLKDIYVNFYPKKLWFTQSNFEIEDYFKIDKVIEFMYKWNWIQVFWDTKSKLDKNSFANECKKFDKSEFEWFKDLFDLILEIKSK